MAPLLGQESLRVRLPSQPMLLVKMLCNRTNLQTKFRMKLSLTQEARKIVYMSKYLRQAGQEAGFEALSNNRDKKRISNSEMHGGKYEQSH